MQTGYIRLERSVTDKQNDLENCPNSNTNLLIAWFIASRPLIVCLTHGSKNVSKLSKFYPSQATFSHTAGVCGKQH